MRSPNHERARSAARTVISLLGINELPSDPFHILKKLKIILEPYSKSENVFPEIIQILRNKKCEAITAIDPNSGEYHIRYDDGDHIPKDRLRFTIAHEIGHAFLGHPKEFGFYFARHGGLVSKDHPAEKEADTFAGELLRPAILMALLGIEEVYPIQTVCNVSYQSASVGVHQIKTLKKFMAKTCTKEIDFFSTQFYNFIHQKRCTTCHHYFVAVNANFCPICGSKTLLWGNPRSFIYEFIDEEIKDMQYQKFEIDENSRAVRCPNCDNEELNYEGNHCIICGTYLINECDGTSYINDDGYEFRHDPGCGTKAPGNARFCLSCGAPTTWNRADIFKSWEEEVKDQE